MRETALTESLSGQDRRNIHEKKYFLIFYLLGLSCGSVFGSGLSVAMNNILIFPIGIAGGMIAGALIGMIYIKIKEK